MDDKMWSDEMERLWSESEPEERRTPRHLGKRRLSVEEGRFALELIVPILGKHTWNDILLEEKQPGEEKCRRTGYRSIKWQGYDLELASNKLQEVKIGHYISGNSLRICVPDSFDIKAEYRNNPRLNAIIKRERDESRARREERRRSYENFKEGGRMWYDREDHGEPVSVEYRDEVRRQVMTGKVKTWMN